MIVEFTGKIADKFAKKYTKTDGTNGISATIILIVGEYNQKNDYMGFETNKPEIIEQIKSLEESQEVTISGYLNCIYGTGKNGKYAVTKINIKQIIPINISTEKPHQETSDDLPF